jgi:hypothetical protein
MMTWRAVAFAAVLIVTVPARPYSHQPLWPGSRFTEADRARAIEHGLSFIYRTALDGRNFDTYGSDYLWCFYEIASTSSDPRLREQAASMGRERAVRWLRKHAHVDPSAKPDDVADVLFAAYAAERLGFADDRLKEELRRAAARFAPADFIGFDPVKGPPRDATNLHDLLCDALITTYTADQFGVTLGAPYREVSKWLSLVRPYRPGPDGVIPIVNLVTHVVYTVNDYQAHIISPVALPDEFAFLKTHVTDREILKDGEMLGEFMDTLRSFGLSTRDEIIQRGFTELLSKQNADGSWGDMNDRDVYDRYHPTWTAIDGLREYRWSH